MTSGQLLCLSTYASMQYAPYNLFIKNIYASLIVMQPVGKPCQSEGFCPDKPTSILLVSHCIALRCAALHCVACVLHVNMFEVPEASMRLGVETPLTPKAPLRAAKCTTHLHHLFHSRVAFSA